MKGDKRRLPRSWLVGAGRVDAEPWDRGLGRGLAPGTGPAEHILRTPVAKAGRWAHSGTPVLGGAAGTTSDEHRTDLPARDRVRVTRQ